MKRSPTTKHLNSVLNFASNATISGTGEIRMIATGQINDAQINAGSVTVTHMAGHTIAGSGSISGNWFNEGDIVADDSKGTGLEISGQMTQSGAGRIGADAGIVHLGNNTLITGGELLTINGGSVQVDVNLASLDNVQNNGDINVLGNGKSLGLDGSIQNNGSINLNSNMNIFNASLLFSADASILGSGTITMFSLGDQNDARIYTGSGVTGTIGANQIVSGSGRIEGTSGGMIINNGTIIANDPAQVLGLGGTHGAGSGVYRAAGDGVLGLNNLAMITGCTFDTSENGIVTVIGSTATMDSVLNLGQMGVRGDSNAMALVGNLTNNGTLKINDNTNLFNASLRFDAPVSLNGSGTTMMVMGSTDNNDARIFTNGAFNGTIGAAQTVMGSGLIDGANGGTIVNTGTIVGTDMVFELALSGNHNGASGGVYRADNGVISLRNSCVINGGTFESLGTGEINKTTNGVATLSNITNMGTMGVRGNGGVIDLSGDLTNHGICAINSDLNVFNSAIRAISDITIGGNGSVQMRMGSSDLNDAQLVAIDTFVMTIGPDQSVEGSGRIEGSGTGVVSNLGTINGNDPVNELRLQGKHDGSAGGVYRSDDGRLSLGNGLVLTGGTFDSSGTGIVEMVSGGTAAISNIHNIGTMGVAGNGGSITLAGGMTNDGTLLINSNSSVFNCQFRMLDSSTIDGTGTIMMVMGSGDNQDAQLEIDAGFVGTFGTGQTLLGEGSLEGEMNILGTLSPEGAIREFTTDTINLADSTQLIIDLGGETPGMYDRFVVRNGQMINLDGTITINLEPGYSPSFGDTWDVINGATTGTFDEVVTGIAPPGQVYRVIYESSRVYVILTCDADLSGDGVINFFDVSEFLSYFSAQDVRGDLNNDGVFNFFDVSTFLQLFSQGCNP
ncbi:MAG: GC-type dockerin domain-anchored protein [Phycisphaerales bacterium]